ncbi:TATA-box factor binding protein, putative [Perkinsus marinus ATCC 50983]|uniref:TATA-box factor binding protein, putative n=1 Tax=Perkinsus marinus (strain ATCC 50983 / TXsc) TaxID=423536 RepID=C5KMP8_PERM5|nr:TATA-box factor binding protein, putative [Perkinsus marinus ATCC 50983]EER14206.1 TATA-box factor binding protein, putative [Perkinsus marinus ATCC 50983]|eukprot:XP_002782411.1 TATA-box factor binding protein, putative [Perkinsus marinus ATCC 50983]
MSGELNMSGGAHKDASIDDLLLPDGVHNHEEEEGRDSPSAGSITTDVVVIPNNEVNGYVPTTNIDDVAINMIPDGMNPVLDNVIASFELGIDIDPKTIAFNLRNCEYNPRKHNCAVIRFTSPTKATCHIYRNGKVMINGAYTIELAKKIGKKIVKLVRRITHNPSIKFINFKVENMIASVDVRFPIRLERLAYDHSAYATYEPELSSGLYFRLFDPKLVIMIYVSGKISFIGGKTLDDISKAFCSIYPLLTQYKD